MDRTHEAYALGYYHGRSQAVTGVPTRRVVELMEDYYRLGYAQGLRDRHAEQPSIKIIDLQNADDPTNFKECK